MFENTCEEKRTNWWLLSPTPRGNTKFIYYGIIVFIVAVVFAIKMARIIFTPSHVDISILRVSLCAATVMRASSTGSAVDLNFVSSFIPVADQRTAVEAPAEGWNVSVFTLLFLFRDLATPSSSFSTTTAALFHCSRAYRLRCTLLCDKRDCCCCCRCCCVTRWCHALGTTGAVDICITHGIAILRRCLQRRLLQRLPCWMIARAIGCVVQVNSTHFVFVDAAAVSSDFAGTDDNDAVPSWRWRPLSPWMRTPPKESATGSAFMCLCVLLCFQLRA